MRCFTVNTQVRPGIVPGFDRHTNVLGIQLRSLTGDVTFPLEKTWAEKVAGIVRRSPVKIDRADFDDTGEFLVPEGEARPDRALVLVRPPRDEEVVFTAGTWNEELRKGKVVRIYRQLREAVGVTPVTFDFNDSSAVVPIDMLLVLDRGASFRMERLNPPRGEPKYVLYQWRDQDNPTLMRRASPFMRKRDRSAA